MIKSIFGEYLAALERKNTTEAMVSTKNKRRNNKSFSKHSKRSNQTCLL